jgi:hypothetical protein
MGHRRFYRSIVCMTWQCHHDQGAWPRVGKSARVHKHVLKDRHKELEDHHMEGLVVVVVHRMVEEEDHTEEVVDHIVEVVDHIVKVVRMVEERVLIQLRSELGGTDHLCKHHMRVRLVKNVSFLEAA